MTFRRIAARIREEDGVLQEPVLVLACVIVAVLAFVKRHEYPRASIAGYVPLAIAVVVIGGDVVKSLLRRDPPAG